MARKKVMMADTVYQGVSDVPNRRHSFSAYRISATKIQCQGSPFVDELHLSIRTTIFNTLRRKRWVVDLLTHLMLDKIVGLVNALFQLICILPSNDLEIRPRKPFGNVAHFGLSVLNR